MRVIAVKRLLKPCTSTTCVHRNVNGCDKEYIVVEGNSCLTKKESKGVGHAG